ncbi:MAG: agglutinin biogenesis protein MshP [Burkholderiaceae bacterium]|nr:MAG: agglutinin biogenesis protein MshP [Burkholderiaceae bacterium]
MGPHSRGFTLVSAIFLVVILAALGAFIISVVRTTASSQNLDLLGQRAYQAAQAGIEWGAFQSLRNNTCTGTTLTFVGTTLADFSTTVTCSSSSADELGTTINLDTIVALACNQPPCPAASPGDNYVERQLTVTVNR